MIIDFAVINDDEAAAVRVHRLIAGRRHVDDREAVMGETDPAFEVEPHRAAVRTAMADASRHCRKRGRLLRL